MQFMPAEWILQRLEETRLLCLQTLKHLYSTNSFTLT